MAQKITGYVKLQIPAGKATPAPPVGPALGQSVLFLSVVLTGFALLGISIHTLLHPAAVLIKKECNIESGSGVPNKNKVATISKASVQKIAEMKMRDLNAGSLEAAMSMIAGTARSMGVVVGD